MMVSAEVGWQEGHIIVSFDVWPDKSRQELPVRCCFQNFSKLNVSFKVSMEDNDLQIQWGYKGAFKSVRIQELPGLPTKSQRIINAKKKPLAFPFILECSLSHHIQVNHALPSSFR